MRLILCDSYDEISLTAARIVASQMILKPDSVLGLATGSTPVGMYHILGDMNKKGEVDFSDAVSFNLDEYYKISPDNEQSYHYFMEKQLFSRINIKPENTHILNGLADNPDEECAAFEALIEQSGGIDLQILGIGRNGHIGFNEPDAALDSKTHLTALSDSTIEANSIYFNNINDMPRHALTMGIGSILKAKKIVLMANGKAKHAAVSELMNDEIKTSLPASLLKVHPDVVLICDREAYAG